MTVNSTLLKLWKVRYKIGDEYRNVYVYAMDTNRVAIACSRREGNKYVTVVAATVVEEEKVFPA